MRHSRALTTLLLLPLLGCFPASGSSSGQAGAGEGLEGRWVMTRGESALDSTGTRHDTSTTGLHLQFEGSRYTLTYKARVASGGLASSFEVTEVGRYRLRRQQLVLSPDRYDGWVENFFEKNRTRLSDRSPRRRSYEAREAPGGWLLTGPCTDFQPNSYCDTGRPITFSLRPTS